MRSRNVSPGFEVMRTLIQSDSTRVPPVTALRSPPDSRMTGALSPVITDSSTDAMPSMTSPSPGMMSLALRRSRRRRRADADAGTCSVRPPGSSRVANDVGLGLAQRVGLGLAARFGHRLGEVREQHREPQPERDLNAEADAGAAGDDVAYDETPWSAPRPTSTTNITGFFDSVTRVELDERLPAVARDTISGSNSGRARASFVGSSDVSSSLPAGGVRAAASDGAEVVTAMESPRVEAASENSLPWCIRKCSTIGPSDSAGKKVSAPTMTTVPTSRPTNRGAVRRQACRWSSGRASSPPGCRPRQAAAAGTGTGR